MKVHNVIKMSVFFLAFFWSGLIAWAEEIPQVMAVNTNENQVIVYVNNTTEMQGVKAAIGQKQCEDISFQSLEEAGTQVRTMFLIDNSLSIPESDRTDLKELLKTLVTGLPNDQIMLASISKSINPMCEWTQDQKLLFQTIDEMEFINQETYLSDALYDYLTNEMNAERGNVLKRIVLISDGVNNKSLGYTAQELISLLKIHPLPIYTIGVTNSDKENAENLERMFSVSRSVVGNSYIFSNLDGQELLQDLNDIWEEKRLSVHIPDSAKDGSLQTLTITLQNGDISQNLSVDQIRMPLIFETETALEIVSEDLIETIESLIPESTVVIESESDTEEIVKSPEKSREINPFLIICVFGIIVALGFLVINQRKQKKHKIPPNSVDPYNVKENKTAILPNVGGVENGWTPSGTDETIYLSEPVYYVRLTDIRYSDRVFERPIYKSLVIGYSPESDICINYDKSVSRKQCEILREGDSFWLVNHSRSNITKLDDVPVTEKTPLYSNTVLAMGYVRVRVDILCEQ